MLQYAFMETLKSRDRDVKASLGFYRKHPEVFLATNCVLSDTV